MARSIEDIIRNAINTGDFTPSAGAGILSNEQARKFIQQTFEATTLGNLVRHEMRTAKAGEIDKIGIASRILREKTEDNDDGYRAGVNTGSIKYSCTDVRLPWEITEETLRENIEGQNLEAIITNLMTTQLGIQTRFRDAAQTSCPRHKRLEHPTLNAFFAKSQHKISVNRAISVY